MGTPRSITENKIQGNRRKIMAYKKPEVVAQNAMTGSYAAGCPAKDHASPDACKYCEHSY